MPRSLSTTKKSILKRLLFLLLRRFVAHRLRNAAWSIQESNQQKQVYIKATIHQSWRVHKHVLLKRVQTKLNIWIVSRTISSNNDINWLCVNASSPCHCHLFSPLLKLIFSFMRSREKQSPFSNYKLELKKVQFTVQGGKILSA